MNLGQIRDLTLKLVNSYSADGVQLPLSDTADIRLAFNDFLNTAYNKAIQYDPVEAVFSITQNPIPNLLNVYDSFNLKQHLDEDIIVSAIGVKAYYFEVDHPANVYLEENINGVWINLATVVVTGIASFTAYSGLITPSNIANTVRMRFSGSYPYNIRRTALYGYTFASSADIPKFQPYISYPLPSDYIRLNKLVQNSDNRLHQTMIDYSIEKRSLVINYFYSGSFDAYYFKRPDPLVLDTDVPEIQVQNHNYLAYFAAGQWLFSNGQQANGIVLLNLFDGFMREITPAIDEVNSSIVNANNW
ncbi:MAG: hypothetical protein Q8911_00050 [Bacillota bacterium]|nr:hypothetical protein [Bacillota bacterium]